jgi:hypothetical protein
MKYNLPGYMVKVVPISEASFIYEQNKYKREIQCSCIETATPCNCTFYYILFMLQDLIHGVTSVGYDLYKNIIGICSRRLE